MKILKTCLLLLAIAAFSVSATSCKRNEQGEGAAEQAGKKIDKALEQAGEEAGRLMEKAGERLQDTGDQLEKKSQTPKGEK
jgi:F0F1-type ATP synthase membrane subunit b/b'